MSTSGMYLCIYIYKKKLFPVPIPFIDSSPSRSADDDRRRSIITGRSASHLFQGEVRSKRGTSLTFEIIFEVERSARDAHTDTHSSLYREITHIHVYTHSAANIHNVASSLHDAFRADDFPLRGTREK